MDASIWSSACHREERYNAAIVKMRVAGAWTALALAACSGGSGGGGGGAGGKSRKVIGCVEAYGGYQIQGGEMLIATRRGTADDGVYRVPRPKP